MVGLHGRDLTCTQLGDIIAKGGYLCSGQSANLRIGQCFHLVRAQSLNVGCRHVGQSAGIDRCDVARLDDGHLCGGQGTQLLGVEAGKLAGCQRLKRVGRQIAHLAGGQAGNLGGAECLNLRSGQSIELVSCQFSHLAGGQRGNLRGREFDQVCCLHGIELPTAHGFNLCIAQGLNLGGAQCGNVGG